QLTPEALLKQEIIEGIIPESNSHRKVCKEIKKILAQELKNLTLLTKYELVKRRKERYRKFYKGMKLMSELLKGKKILVMGVANKRSIAWGCSQMMVENGAELIFTYQNDRIKKSLSRLVSEEEKLVECDV